MRAEARNYCVRIDSESFPGLRYLLKSLDGDQRAIDPDLNIPYDLSYRTNDDGTELASRLLTRQEATAARNRVHKMIKAETLGDRARISTAIIEVDLASPLSAFADERHLLRLLPMWLTEQARDRFEEFSFAWSSSLVDGLRLDSSRLLFRRAPQEPEICYSVQARRTTPGLEANVVCRYGRPFQNVAGPRARLERFGCLEWDYPIWGSLTEGFHVTASRALTQAQAQVLAEVLRSSEDEFADVVIASCVLGKFHADEGLSPQTYGPVFARSTEESERECGFPHFLSVWRD